MSNKKEPTHGERALAPKRGRNSWFLKILKQGAEKWNELRKANPKIRPILRGVDLSGANLSGADLSGADLSEANLSEANLRKANLREANLCKANLSGAILYEANLLGADLSRAILYKANLRGADLSGANLLGADLSGANLRKANLSEAILYEANLRGADLSGANLSGVILRYADLREAFARGGPQQVPPGLGLSAVWDIVFPGRRLVRKGAGNEHLQGSFTLLSETKALTPRILSIGLTPYLNAIASVQGVIHEIERAPQTDVQIRLISQNSPIQVNLSGADKAIESLKNIVIPWKRKHEKVLARLQEQTIKAEIEIKKAESTEKEAKANKDHAEAEKMLAEATKQRAEAKKVQLENEKAKLELYQLKIQLTLEMLSNIAPNLSETEKISYVVKLLPPLEVITSSELVMSTDERDSAE